MSALMCLLVVFIHISGEAVTTLARPSVQSLIVYIPWKLSSFAVPCFIFLAGMKQSLPRTHEQSYLRYLLGRLKSVVLPYVLWNIVYYAYFVAVGYITPSPLGLLASMLKGDLSAQLYFVVIIVQFYLLRPLWQVIVERYPPLPVLTVALTVTLICSQYIPFWFSDRLLVAYLVFWLAGCYCGKYRERFVETLKTYRVEVFCVFVFFAAALIIFTYLTFCQTVFFGFLGILSTAYSLAAVCAVYLACLYIPCTRVMGLLDRASYSIYLMHVLVLLVTDALLGELSPKWDLAIKLVVVYGVSLAVCAGCVIIKKK